MNTQIDQHTNATFSDYADVDDGSKCKVEVAVTESVVHKIKKEVAEFIQHDIDWKVSQTASKGRSDCDNNENKGNDSSEDEKANENLENENPDVPPTFSFVGVKVEVKEDEYVLPDNEVEDQYQMDGGPKATFSDHSDVDSYFESNVEVMDNIVEEKIDAAAEFTNDEENNIREASLISDEGNESKDNDSIEEDILSDNIEETIEDSGDSTDSEYLPEEIEQPKIKRARGRPRKTPKKAKEKDQDQGEFPCPACQEICTTMTQLARHARIEHEGLKLHKCSKCNKAFDSANQLRLHSVSHLPSKSFQCSICSKGYTSRYQFNEHQKLHEEPNVCECDICGLPYTKAIFLANHKLSKHGISKVIRDKKYKCPHCHKGFTTEKYKDHHVNIGQCQKEYPCKVCKETFLSKSDLFEHMKSHTEHFKKFVCPECDQRFIRKDYLTIHIRRHRGEKPFKCKYCGKGFPRPSDLTVHERYHTGEKTHFCSICGKGFGRAYNLQVHMRTHTGERPYQCTYCDSAFAQGNDLKEHVRRHTGETVRCELCSKNFLSLRFLARHKRTVHELNGSNGRLGTVS